MGDPERLVKHKNLCSTHGSLQPRSPGVSMGALLLLLILLGTVVRAVEAKLPTTPDKSSSVPSAIPVRLTDLNFNTLVNGSDVWVIDVHSPWCPACQELKPVWDRLAARSDRDYQVGEINIQLEKVLMHRFGIRQIPTILLVSQEGDIYEFNGAFSVNSLHQFASKGWTKQRAENGGGGPLLEGCASPATRCGKAIGAVMTIPRWAKDTFLATRREFKHDVGLVAAIIAGPVFAGLCFICALDMYVVRKSKRNRRQRV